MTPTTKSVHTQVRFLPFCREEALSPLFKIYFERAKGPYAQKAVKAIVGF